MKSSKLTFIILILFFFSGLASLIYEVIWARNLGLVFGTTSYAISTILAVFMAGLALGSFLFGKIVDKFLEPRKFLFLVGLLGIGEGTYALFTPFIFKLIEKLQLILVGDLTLTFNLNLLRFSLSFLALILPTTLCGGTLPVLSKFLIRFREEVGKKFGFLYSINTFGGVAGVILAGFFLIIPLGVNGTIYVAGLIDILAGFCFLGLSFMSNTIFRANSLDFRATSSPSIKANLREYQAKNHKHLPFLILFIFFFTGFLALALEVLWTRVLVMTLGSSTYAFSLILAAFLVGIALGSILIAKFVDRIKNLWFALGLTIGLIGISVVFLTPFFDDLPFLFLKIFGTFGESFWKLEAGIFSLIFLLLLLPTILMGIIFPIGTKIYVKNLQKVGGRVGEIYSINTLGCIFGSFLAGFLFLPAFGLLKSILISALIYFLLAAIIFLFTIKKLLPKAVLILILLGLGVFSLSFFQWNKYALTSGPAVYARQYLLKPEIVYGEPEKEKIIFYKDGLSANVAVSQIPKGYLAMRVNGKVDASAGKIEFKEIGDLDTMLLTGYLPLLLHPGEPENALIVGLGSGITLGAMTQYPLNEIDLVEIEPAVVEGAEYFKEFNHDALNNPRVKIIIEDGRNLLLISPKKYDIISSQPSNPWVKGNANLFTKEYYELCKNRLKENGLMFQWVQLYSLDKEDLKSVIYTFSKVFPYSQIWSSTNFKDLFLIGSLTPLKVDKEKFSERFNISGIKEDFKRAAISEPEEILSQFIFSQEQIKKFEKARIHIDNHPFLEFQAPLALYKDTVSENLEELYSFREDIERLFGIKLSQEVKDFQEKALLATIAKERGDSEGAIEFYEEALKIKSNSILEGKLAEYYYAKGKLAALEGKTEKALAFYQKAVELNPKEPVFLNSLGSAYFKEGDFEKAEFYFKRAIEVGPYYTWGFSNLGLIYLRQEKYDLAEKYLREALKIKEENTDALNWLAIVYYNRGEYEKAKECLEKSLEINPDQPKTKERLKELQ